jgi:glycosyltransferase involved in cell wall biosynthesis
MRVLFLNDYPMCKARELNLRGLYPSQHLWGMYEIEKFGIEPIYFPDKTWIGSPAKLKFSVQQLQAWLISGKYDVIYSACQFNTWLLARLRVIGALNIPLVTIVHHPLLSPLQKNGYVRGHDALLFLSDRVRKQTIEEFGSMIKLSATLPWGPDTSFFKGNHVADTSIDVFSAGKTNRDFNTLIQAAKSQDWRVRIYCADRNIANSESIPENVSIYSNESGIVLDYKQLYEISSKAKVIAIPLLEVDALAGLTSVLDAIALGKPIVMTRNKWLDLDPEHEGFGFSVEPNDVDGWIRACNMIIKDDILRDRMSKAAIKVSQRLNMEEFSRKLSEVMYQVVDSSR